MKFSRIWVAMAGVLAAMTCVSCGGGSGGGAENGTAPGTAVISTTTDADADAIAAWYAKARQ